MCTVLKGSVTKSCKFISKVKHHTQRVMLAQELYHQWVKCPQMWGLYKSKLQNSAQLQTVLALCDQELARNNGQPNYSRLKTAVKLHIDQMMRTRNFRVTFLKEDVYMATNATSDMLRQKESPAKSQRKVVRKDQLRYWRSLYNCVFQDSFRENPVLRELGKLGTKHADKFSKGTLHLIKIRERKGPSRWIIPKCASWA